MALVNSIGGMAFMSLNGGVDPRQEVLDVLSRNGVDGVAVRPLGQRSKPFTLTSFDMLASTTVAKTTLETAKAKVGTLVQIIQIGEVWGDYMLVDVSQRTKTVPVANAKGGLVAHAPHNFIQVLQFSFVS